MTSPNDGMTGKKREMAIDLAVIAVVISVIVLIAYKMNGIFPFGEESLARGDMTQQTIPAEMYYMWDVLHGKASPFFTWNSAFGLNLSGASSLGALLSPLNLLLYFSTRDFLVYYVSWFVLLKMIAMAYAMYFYLRKYDVKNVIYIAGGMLYAFGAAALVHFQIMLVMDAAFFLPFIMMGIDRIFEKKGCKLFIFFLAWAMIVNVYTGCIMLIFLFLSCGLRIFLRTPQREERRRCALWLGVSVGSALLLSAVVSIPALFCIQNSPRTSYGTLTDTYQYAINHTWSEYEWKTVERMIVNIALPVSCILYFLTFGKSRWLAGIKKYKSQICMVFLLFLSVAVSGIELLWHGGSRASWPVRFVFVITFVLIEFAVVLCEENKELIEQAGRWMKSYLIRGIAVAAAVVVSGWFFVRLYEKYCEWESYAEAGDGYLCIWLEIGFLALYLIFWKIKKKEFIFCLLCIQLTCTTIVSFAPNKDNVTVFSSEYLGAANDAAVNMEEIEITDFERIKNMDYTVDHIQYPLVLGEQAISNYWHVIPSTLQPVFAALGYSVNWTQCLDTGGTIFSDTLFQIQYCLSGADLPEELYEYCEDVEGDDKELLQLYKNKYKLPFVVSTNVQTLSASDDKFETQNQLFTAVTGSSGTLIEDVTGQIADSRFITDVGSGKKILYFYATNTSANPIQIRVNGTPVNFPSSTSPEDQNYPADFCNGLVCLGVFENEHIQIDFSGITNLYDVHLGMMDESVLSAGMDAVNHQETEITSLKKKNSGVKIQLSGVTKSNVFLPVSYDEGWVCRVNGKRVSQIYNMDGMLSIPVEEGENTIELTYVAPGRTMGAAVSAGTLAVIAVFLLLSRKKNIHMEKTMLVAGYTAYVIFAIAFAAAVLFLFVIPLWSWFQGLFAASE